MSRNSWNSKLPHLEGWRVFLRITRFARPEGTLLLCWPCFWGYLYTAHPLRWQPIAWCIGGALWMRSLGCVYNDWVDHKFDPHVTRTQHRFSLRQTDIWHAPYIYIAGVGIILALSTLPLRVIAWGALGWANSFLYPWSKRYITPQYGLGLLFAWGVWIGAAMSDTSHMESCLGLYVIAALWTIEYDAVYSAPDCVDDKKLGLKSMATVHGHRLYHVLMLIVIFRGCLMSYLAWPCLGAISSALLLSCVSTGMLFRLPFAHHAACQKYFIIQAWMYGPLMTLWVWTLP
jgi:4-hydroxybenzoate polyprenyltransferase